jgi:hypothetical protein
MAPHKFTIGQMVEFDGSTPSILRPKGPYEVVSVLPPDGSNSPTYRVKSEAELFVRAAREFDLVAVRLPPGQQTSALWADSRQPAVAIEQAKRRVPQRRR